MTLWLEQLRRVVSRVFEKFKIFVSGLWAIPCVLAIRLVNPFVNISLGSISNDRIGHFVTDACEQKLRAGFNERKRKLDLFWLPGNSSNLQWEKMVRRELPVYNWVKYLDLWNRYLPGGFEHSRPSTYTISRDVQGICRDGKGKFSFTEREDRVAKSWLSKFGWKEGLPFVCVLVRDAAYLNQRTLGGDNSVGLSRWSYHNYRDSDIESFRPSLEWLADQGVWIFRMGKIAEKPLNSEHSRVIDYAFLKDKSDFLDIWLFAHCEFCISTGTGADAVSMVYGRPNLYLNALPLGDLHSFHQSTWVPKHLIWQATHRELTLPQYCDAYFTASKKYEDSGIEVKELSEEEIKDSVQEFYLRYLGTWKDSAIDLDLHRKFWTTLENWSNYTKYHDWRHPESRTATVWLRARPAEFFNPS